MDIPAARGSKLWVWLSRLFNDQFIIATLRFWIMESDESDQDNVLVFRQDISISLCDDFFPSVTAIHK